MASTLQAAPTGRKAEPAPAEPAAAPTEETTDVAVPTIDPQEMDEWLESVDDILHRYGPEAVGQLLTQLYSRAQGQSVSVVPSLTTPYINTIAPEDEAPFPGDRALERQLRSIIRWNAMAMVVRAYRTGTGVGGHISTFASCAMLVEIGFNHFFHARTEDHAGDMVYFQGHSSPGMYSRAFVEGRLTEQHLVNFRREIPRGQGLST
jgi:pyruvate dehydrogenase E1 component